MLFWVAKIFYEPFWKIHCDNSYHSSTYVWKCILPQLLAGHRESFLQTLKISYLPKKAFQFPPLNFTHLHRQPRASNPC